MQITNTINKADGTTSYFLSMDAGQDFACHTVYCHIKNGDVTGCSFVEGSEPYLAVLDAIEDRDQSQH